MIGPIRSQVIILSHSSSPQLSFPAEEPLARETENMVTEI